MPKNSVSEWDTTAANNTDIGGVDLAENSMRPRDVNNAIRTMMAQIRTNAPSGATTDNTLPRFNGTAGALQTSGVVVDDSNNISGLGSIKAGADIASGEATRTFNLIDSAAVLRVWRYLAISNSSSPAVELIQGTGATAGDAANTWWDIYTTAVGGSASADRMIFRRRTGGGFVESLIIDANQQVLVSGSLGRNAPVTKTANFTVAATENWLINNKSGSSCTVTLPAASSFPGREIMIKTIQAQTTVSASSNVVPLGGGAAGTAILSANAGRWATLVSDGTNWIIMAGVI